MPTLTISADGSHLQRGGEPWPYVADTAWSAFADISSDDWVGYLNRRRLQGFTSVAISILPILHDRSVRAGSREPFAIDDEGHYDFSRPDQSYFATAARMVGQAIERGIVPTLVLLWCNYVPGTWGSARTPWAVMEQPDREAYISLVARTFADHEPIFAVSGDDDFTSAPAVAAYEQALKQLAEAAPRSLITAHSTPQAVLPDVLADSPDLDFFVYQSGHDHLRQDRCWLLAEQYRRRRIRKPVANLEPAYEFHGYGGGAGRYGRADVRRASWWSILGGASAGIGYGAHGIWQWHIPEAQFTSPDFSLEPAPWSTALQFRGADDVSLLAQLWRLHRLHRLDAGQGLLGAEVDDSPGPGFRAAASTDGRLVAVYLPFSRQVDLHRDLSKYAVSAWDLQERRPITPTVTVDGEVTRIGQADVAADSLLLFERPQD